MATFCRTHRAKIITAQDAADHQRSDCILETEGSSMEVLETTTTESDIFPKIEKMEFKDSDMYS